MSHVKVKRIDPVVVLKPDADLWGGDETVQLGQEMDALTVEGNRFLVINLEECSKINSTAIGVLAEGLKKYTARGAQIVLCNVHKRITNALTIVRLVDKFDIYNSEERAVASFAGRGGA